MQRASRLRGYCVFRARRTRRAQPHQHPDSLAGVCQRLFQPGDTCSQQASHHHQFRHEPQAAALDVVVQISPDVDATDGFARDSPGVRCAERTACIAYVGQA